MRIEIEVEGVTAQKFLAGIVVDNAIVNSMIPEMYYVIDELLSNEGKKIPKDLKVQARRLLPGWCENSFQKH